MENGQPPQKNLENRQNDPIEAKLYCLEDPLSQRVGAKFSQKFPSIRHDLSLDFEVRYIKFPQSSIFEFSFINDMVVLKVFSKFSIFSSKLYSIVFIFSLISFNSWNTRSSKLRRS